MTPEEIADNISLAFQGKTFGGNYDWKEWLNKGVAKAIREAEERGAAKVTADANECGLWCPKCGAHLRGPEGL
jgi:hypothetical protein